MWIIFATWTKKPGAEGAHHTEEAGHGADPTESRRHHQPHPNPGRCFSTVNPFCHSQNLCGV